MTFNAGSNTIVTQQWMSLCKNNINQHTRSRFLYDLKMLILNLQLKNTEIILELDANLAQPIDPKSMTFLTDCNLYDLIHQKPYDNLGPIGATHKDRNRLDLIVRTKYVLKNLVAAGSISNNLLAPSDHVGCLTDLHQHIFAPSANPVSPMICGITSKQRKKFKLYGVKVDTELSNKRKLQKLLTLQD